VSSRELPKLGKHLDPWKGHPRLTWTNSTSGKPPGRALNNPNRFNVELNLHFVDELGLERRAVLIQLVTGCLYTLFVAHTFPHSVRCCVSLIYQCQQFLGYNVWITARERGETVSKEDLSNQGTDIYSRRCGCSTGLNPNAWACLASHEAVVREPCGDAVDSSSQPG
jgi:hypothetical protein